jgi:deoxyadenosine/deoxycytidine kinase
MGYLETWIPFLRRQALAKDIVVVLDPGSVYWLTALRQFGPEITTSHQYERWWNTMFRQWAAALDGIIWLDAPDELLYARILARDEWHEAKEQSQKKACEIFMRYRAWYGQITAAMTARSGLKVFHFHTDQISSEQMADSVLSVMKLKNGRS